MASSGGQSAGLQQGESALADTAGGVLSDLVRSQLREEGDRRQSLEQRGITVITTAGALVTLLIAVGGAGRLGSLNGLPIWTKAIVFLPLPFFALASLLGLAANWVSSDVVVDEDAFNNLLTPELWGQPASGASFKVTKMYTTVLHAARHANQTKAKLLRMAIVAEAIAVSILAAGVGAAVWVS
jgi:hypothetical protein